jgi:hypothetical protein
MTRQHQAGGRIHSLEVGRCTSACWPQPRCAARHIEVGASELVHVLEIGAGPTVVLLHGTGYSAAFSLPLLHVRGPMVGDPGERGLEWSH